MKRRLIKLGSSYAVALPKNWITRFGLERKQEVIIEETDGALNLMAGERKAAETEARIQITEDQTAEELYIRVYRAYINGASTIILSGQLQKKQFDVVAETQKRFLGLEVIEQNEKRIVFRDFVHVSDFEFDTLLSRIFSGLAFMAEEIKRHVSKNEDSGDKLRDMDIISGRTINLAFRCCNMALRDSAYMRQAGKTAKEIIIISRMLKNLEKAGRLLVGIAYQMNENATVHMREYGYVVFKRQKEINLVVTQFLTEWQAYLSEIRTAYFKRDAGLAIRIYSERRTRKTMNMIFGGTERLKKETPGVNHEYLAKLESVFEPIVSLSYDVAKDILLLDGP